jgi:divalent metal cation (Fe/Co/Zn/Cd) transporter
MTNLESRLYRQAFMLSFFTIFYNVVEGVISMVIGYTDETLSLFGFGADSFIEVMSGVGVAVMVMRIRKNPESPRSQFEKTALRVTGTSFYLLSAGLLLGIILNVIHHQRPETTFWGVVISLVSIIAMTWLMVAKKGIGKKLNSKAIIADANCTKICIYMSLVLLTASMIYELTGFVYADAIGAAGLAYLSFNEGKEAFGKSKGEECGCCEEWTVQRRGR